VFFVERPRVDPDDSEVHVIYDEEDQQPFAADVRIACLQSQDTPLLSIHDLNRSLKQQGGYAKVAWGDYSTLKVSDGYAVVEIPLERVGAYIRLRGNTDCRKAFIVDPEGDECIIVDTGAGISCCGPDCKFFDDPSDPPASLRLMRANSSPLQILKVEKFRLVFGHPYCQTIGILFVALDYA
jgi:hypothetical protein